jgi:hypothetical protein
MSAKVDIDVANVQEAVEDASQETAKYVRKAMLTALGVAGYAYDGAVAVWHEAGEFAGKAEKRGEKMQAEFNQNVQKVQDQVTDQVKHRRSQLEDTLNDVTKEVQSAGKSVESRVQKTFSSLKLGETKTVIVGDVKIEIPDLPIPNYDELNAQALIDQLSSMDDAALTKLRDYEMAHKNRVTVLRDIEERLKDMAEHPAVA